MILTILFPYTMLCVAPWVMSSDVLWILEKFIQHHILHHHMACEWCNCYLKVLFPWFMTEIDSEITCKNSPHRLNETETSFMRADVTGTWWVMKSKLVLKLQLGLTILMYLENNFSNPIYIKSTRNREVKKLHLICFVFLNRWIRWPKPESLCHRAGTREPMPKSICNRT